MVYAWLNSAPRPSGHLPDGMRLAHSTVHRLLRAEGLPVVVVGNAGADMKAGTLGHVLKQAGMNEDKMESGDAAN